MIDLLAIKKIRAEYHTGHLYLADALWVLCTHHGMSKGRAVSFLSFGMPANFDILKNEATG